MILLLATLIYSSSLCFVDASPRIVGGSKVLNRNEYAYQISLRKSGHHTCGGSLIDSQHVLTAAHCVHDSETKELLPASDFSIATGNLKLTGDPDQVTKKVKYIFVHEHYNGKPNFHDLALLRLSSNFTTSSLKIQPIALNSKHVISGTCTVSGWGTVQSGSNEASNDLLYVDVPVVPWYICNIEYRNSLSQEMLCAGATNKDSCQGDSGGPLKCDSKLTGIVSFGNGCGKEGYAGVYTEVFPYIDWIEKQQLRSSSFRHVASAVPVTISVIFYILRLL